MKINKVEIIIEFSVPKDLGGEDIQEQRFIFIRPEKIQRLVKEPSILSEIIQQIQAK